MAKSNDIYDLTRLINTRLGMGRKDDSLPYKVRACPIRAGATAGKDAGTAAVAAKGKEKGGAKKKKAPAPK